MSYAFKDETGILHVHPDKHTAAAHGKHVETDLRADESGFPIVDGKGTILYPDGRAFVDGNKEDGKEISAPKVLTDLAAQL